MYYKTEQLKINLSSYLVDDLGQDYSMLSKLFSEKKERHCPLFYCSKLNVQKHFITRWRYEIAIQIIVASRI
jgi:hypothetical protein